MFLLLDKILQTICTQNVESKIFSKKLRCSEHHFYIFVERTSIALQPQVTLAAAVKKKIVHVGIITKKTNLGSVGVCV